MIYCIWYPGGGFGHFVNGIISLYGHNFARPARKHYNFGQDGNSHNIALAVPKYFHDQDYPEFDFNHNMNYSVLIDNGNRNEGKNFCQTFTNATIIKICYSTEWWPVIAQTIIIKAMKENFEQQLYPDADKWPINNGWAQREKYFLHLRDHEFRNTWKDDPLCKNLHIDNLLNYQQFYNKLQEFGIHLDEFFQDWQRWHQSNYQYFFPVVQAKQILLDVKNQKELDLSNITNIWEQAVINYFIWLTYHVEVPANDYAEWFTNTKDIVIMLKKLGIYFDSN